MPLSILDDQRVLAQHREIHALLGSIGSPKFGYQNHPVTKLYLPKTGHLNCLLDYHELTVGEMKNRGWTGHKTPLKPEHLAEMTSRGECSDWEEHCEIHASEPMPAHGQARDMHDLIKRWTAEHKPLRNDLAVSYVLQHAADCDDEACHNRIMGLAGESGFRALEEAGMVWST